MLTKNILCCYFLGVATASAIATDQSITLTELTQSLKESDLIATATTMPEPTQSGIDSNCDGYYEVASGDTCVGIVNNYDITLADFYSWNPAVGSKCQVLLAGYYVCVGVAANTTTTTTTPTATSDSTPVPSTSLVPISTVPSPTQNGIASDCTEYYEAQSGDTCMSIVAEYSVLDLSEFESWNPAVGNDCLSLLAGYYYCVAT